MSENIKLSPINQKIVQDKQTANQNNNTSTNFKVSDNRLKQDTYINSHKKVITFGSILGGVGIAVGVTILVYKGILGSKAQNFVQGIVNKFSGNVTTATSKATSTVPTKTPPTVTTKPIDVRDKIEVPKKPIQETPHTVVKQPVINKPVVLSVNANNVATETNVHTSSSCMVPGSKVQNMQSEIVKGTREVAGTSYHNPVIGDNINLATTNSSKTIDICAEENGVYVKHSIILDESSDLYTSKVITGGKLYSENLPDNDAARARMYTPNHELPDDWLEAYELDYEFISEAEMKKFPTLRSYAEYRSNPERLQDNQLRRVIKNIPPTQQEYFLYRGVNLSTKPQQYIDILQGAKIGDIIIPDWGVSCATPDSSYAIKHYTGGGTQNTALLKIKTPIGSRLFGLHKDGFTEYHMPSMSKYKLTGKHQIGNLAIYDLDYIMPDLSKV